RRRARCRGGRGARLVSVPGTAARVDPAARARPRLAHRRHAGACRVSRVARLLASMFLLAALATECLRYRAEHELAHARDEIGQVLRSGDAARAAREMPDLVVRLEHQPDDVRRDLLLGLALILA